MSTPAAQVPVRVLARRRLSAHLLRLELGGPGLAGLTSTGIADEWVGLVVPGQFQSRYYTVRSWRDDVLVLDVVVHDEGLVTTWASGDPVGDEVVLTEPKGSFLPAPDAAWVLLVGDLTAFPAMARCCEALAAERPGVPVRVWAEVPDDTERAALADYFPADVDVTWSTAPGPGESDLARVVEGLEWPAGEGYFWMAGESSQMRAIRKHLMRVRALPSTAYDVMGYWRGGGQRRQPRAIDREVAGSGPGGGAA